MQREYENRLIILAGPSCVGKSPLVKALAKFHPDLAQTLQALVLYNDRDPRPGESDGVDYYFRSQRYIENLKGNDQFVVMKVRGDLQALDLAELSDSLNRGNVLFEGNPFIGKILLTHPYLSRVNRLSIFMSPLSKDDILNYNTGESDLRLSDRVTYIMRQKLLKRTTKQKGKLTDKDHKDIEQRASSAYKELVDAHLYQFVIPNRDGEDSDNWEAFPNLIGDALLALEAFVELLSGNIPDRVEHWTADLIS